MRPGSTPPSFIDSKACRAARLSCAPDNRGRDPRETFEKRLVPTWTPTYYACGCYRECRPSSIAHLRTDSLAIAWPRPQRRSADAGPGCLVWRESPSLGGFTQTGGGRAVELANGFGPGLLRTPVMDDGGSPSSSKHYSTLVTNSPAFARGGSSLAVTGDWNARPCEGPRAPGRAVRPLGSSHDG
jgi:hypothetical protein